jgi:hypothetical protein
MDGDGPDTSDVVVVSKVTEEDDSINNDTSERVEDDEKIRGGKGN